MKKRILLSGVVLALARPPVYAQTAYPTKEVVNKLNSVIVGGWSVPEIRQQLANQGIEAREATPEQFAKFARTEIEKMAPIIKASGARPE